MNIDDITYGEVNIDDQVFFEYIENKSSNHCGKYVIFTNYPEKYATNNIAAYNCPIKVRGYRANFVYVMSDIVKGNTDDINEILSGVLAISGGPNPTSYQIIINRGVKT